MMRTMFIVLLVWMLLSYGADVLFKTSVGPKSQPWMIPVGCVSYGSCGFLAVWSYKRLPFYTLAAFWSAASLLVGLFIATIYFRETLTPLRIAMGLAALLAAILSVCDHI
jgi:multidrug transporter EmrE-like cation transporter